MTFQLSLFDLFVAYLAEVGLDCELEVPYSPLFCTSLSKSLETYISIKRLVVLEPHIFIKLGIIASGIVIFAEFDSIRHA